jgi:hypothetical protein
VNLDGLLPSLLVATAILAVLYTLYRLVRWAWSRARGAYVVGAVLAPFGAGNVVDPDFRTVNEAKQQKKRQEDDVGDPPNPEGGDARRWLDG